MDTNSMSKIPMSIEIPLRANSCRPTSCSQESCAQATGLEGRASLATTARWGSTLRTAASSRSFPWRQVEILNTQTFSSIYCSYNLLQDPKETAFCWSLYRLRNRFVDCFRVQISNSLYHPGTFQNFSGQKVALRQRP